MKVLIVTQNAPVYLATFMNDFLMRLKTAGHTVAGVAALSPIFKKSVMAEMKKRLAYYGPFDFARLSARIFWNKGLACLGRCTSLKNVLKRHGIERWLVSDVNGADFIDRIKREGIEVVISIASPKIFKRDLLRAPARGSINYHTALLPKYRGRQPLFWALLDDEKQVGITVHEMDEKLDNGGILAQRAIPVDPGDSLHDLYVKTIAAGPQVLIEGLEKLQTGGAKLPNDESQSSYFGFPKKEDAKKFRAAGKRFF
jgi:methionyl-tRNA formyltransferase